MSVRSVISVRDGAHEPFRVSVCARAARRDLHGLDAGVGQDRVTRRGALPGPVPDQEPEVRGPITQVHQQGADLLPGPRTVRVRGDPGDVRAAAAGLHDEQAGQPPQGHRAAPRGRSRWRASSMPGCAGTSASWRRYAVAVPAGSSGALRTRRIAGALTRWPSLRSSPWIRWYGQPWFSVASRSISAAVSALTGGRPVRCGSARVRAIRRRCHRRTVPGLTSRCTRSVAGRSRMSAARTARSAQPGPGPGIGAAQHGHLVPQHEQPGVRGGR